MKPKIGEMVCFSLGKGRDFGRVVSHTDYGFWVKTDKVVVFYAW